jgi:hypothetical protein
MGFMLNKDIVFKSFREGCYQATVYQKNGSKGIAEWKPVERLSIRVI